MKETIEQSDANRDYRSFNTGVEWYSNAIKELLQRENLLKIEYPSLEKPHYDMDSYRMSIQLIDGDLWLMGHQEDWEGDWEHKIDTLDNLLNKSNDRNI